MVHRLEDVSNWTSRKMMPKVTCAPAFMKFHPARPLILRSKPGEWKWRLDDSRATPFTKERRVIP
jgi:hypothetical protein